MKDALSVNGAAEDFSDLDFTVDRRDRYEAGSKRWTELSGTWRDRRVFLEVHHQDTVEVLGNFDGRKITLDELGLSETDMGGDGSAAEPRGFLDFEGKFWLYRFSREMGVFSCRQYDGPRFLRLAVSRAGRETLPERSQVRRRAVYSRNLDDGRAHGCDRISRDVNENE